MRVLAPEEGEKVPDQCGYRQLREESWNGENNILQMACSLEVKHRHEEELQLGARTNNQTKVAFRENAEVQP